MKIERGFPYKCDNGGTVTIITNTENVKQTGVDTGYAFWGDIYVNAKNNMSLDVSSHDTQATLEYGDGETVISFNLTSRVPSGIADIKFRNLKPNSYYRLLFNERIVDAQSGKTHDITNDDGTLSFKEVTVPDE